MHAPRSKAEFYRRYLKGEFGNRARDWSSWPELRDSGFRGLIGIRSLYRGGPCWYNVPRETMERGEWPAGCNPDRVNFSEMLPDQFLILQGEIVRMPTGLELFYSTVRKPMRMALSEGPRNARGSAALEIARFAMWPTSFSDFEALMERYPDAAIEFSCYEVAVGNIPHRNTVFWEVREY